MSADRHRILVRAVEDAGDSAFEAFALVGAAHGSMSPAEYAGCTLPQVKAEWGTLPLIVGGKEVVR